MLNLHTSTQIREVDAFTIINRPISSVDLMEAASRAFVRVFRNEIPDKDITISIYCGTGNNGGDGAAIARLLKEDGYERLSVKIVRFSKRSTDDFNTNLNRLQLTGIPLTEISSEGSFPEEDAGILIDALIGSGLNKPLKGLLKSLVIHLNSLDKRIIAVDIPSGFPAEGIIDPAAVMLRADLAICFQRPKINFFFPESAVALDRFKTADIGLDENFIQSLSGFGKLIEECDIRKILKPRRSFSHKGTYGHALIVAGSQNTMGAALLCADACLHSGAGLTSACIPVEGLTALNTYIPEVMFVPRHEFLTDIPGNKYDALATGPGLGTDTEAISLIERVLEHGDTPLVLDADALNILASNPQLLKKLPADTIISPHLKEFDRIFSPHTSWWKRVETARQKAAELKIIILLKNRYSFIALPDGDLLINPTGNPAMAVGGMGDVLTGMIAAFLAQGYTPAESVILGCYLHGRSGDKLKESGMNSIPPGNLIESLPFIINLFS